MRADRDDLCEAFVLGHFPPWYGWHVQQERLTAGADLQASEPEVRIGLSRAGVPACRRPSGCSTVAVTRSSRPRSTASSTSTRPEGRAHVALPRGLRGGDRRGRDRREAPRREPRRAHRPQHRRAPAGPARRGEDRRALPHRAAHTRDRAPHPGARDADRDRSRLAHGDAARGRSRGDGDQRVPVRAGASSARRPPGGSPRPASRRETSSGSSSSSRLPPTTSAAAARSSSEPRSG